MVALTALDIAVLTAYFVAIIALEFWAGRPASTDGATS